MRHIMRKPVIFLLSTVWLLINIVLARPVLAKASVPCSEVTGSNTNGMNYSVSASPVYSYLIRTETGYSRIEYCSDTGLFVEYYDNDLNLSGRDSIPEELPLFGAFYESDQYFFVVTGQNNPDNSNSVETYRITRYDKSWNRLDSSSLYGANTTKPFYAGSCRLADNGKYLIVRTCHLMYNGHQACVTIQYNMETGQITDSMTKVINTDYGYVSHSFNQFVVIDEDILYTMDHGDGNPRSFVMIKHGTTGLTTDQAIQASGGLCTAKSFLSFQGYTGDNYTKASAGGFERTEGGFLMAGNTVDQSSKEIFESASIRNVFCSYYDETSDEVTTWYHTDYNSKGVSVSTPHLVKISDNKLMLLWATTDDNIHYCLVSADGGPISKTFTKAGYLSECKPILDGDSVLWYQYDNTNVTFYRISISDPDKMVVQSVETGHDYRAESLDTNSAEMKCSKCGKTKKIGIVTSCDVSYHDDTCEPEVYYNQINTNRTEGNIVSMWLQPSTTSDCSESDLRMVVESSDESVIKITTENASLHRYLITCLKPGTAVIKVYPVIGSNFMKEITFTVSPKESIADAEVENIPDMTYTGEPIRPDLAISYNGKVLTEGSDFTVSYADNTNCGLASAIITGKGEYGGTKTITFNIIPDSSQNGFYPYNDGWYYCKSGNKITSTGLYKGTIEGTYKWYYVSKGKADLTYTGFGKNKNGWYYVENGTVSSKTGLIKDSLDGTRKWYMVVKGKVNLTYTGFGQNKNGWYYVKNGSVSSKTGLFKGTVNGTRTWWKVVKGKVSFTDGVASNANGTYYVTDGAVDYTFNGTYTDPETGITYTIVNGKAQP